MARSTKEYNGSVKTSPVPGLGETITLTDVKPETAIVCKGFKALKGLAGSAPLVAVIVQQLEFVGAKVKYTPVSGSPTIASEKQNGVVTYIGTTAGKYDSTNKAFFGNNGTYTITATSKTVTIKRTQKIGSAIFDNWDDLDAGIISYIKS